MCNSSRKSQWSLYPVPEKWPCRYVRTANVPIPASEHGWCERNSTNGIYNFPLLLTPFFQGQYSDPLDSCNTRRTTATWSHSSPGKQANRVELEPALANCAQSSKASHQLLRTDQQAIHNTSILEQNEYKSG
jgi:hypothetical protein